MVSQVFGGQDTKVYVAALFPATLAFLVRAVDRRSLSHFIWFGLMAGLLLLGHPVLSFYAYMVLGIWGLDWAHAPTIGPAIVVGLGTIVAPWFVMQPAMGAGLAGSRTPDPRTTRLRNLAMHGVYGIGLYLAAVASSVAWVSRPAP